MNKNNWRKYLIFAVLCVFVFPYLVKADAELMLGTLRPGVRRNESISIATSFGNFSCEKTTSGPYSIETVGSASSGRLIIKVDDYVDKKYTNMKVKCTFSNFLARDLVYNYVFDIAAGSSGEQPTENLVQYNVYPGDYVNLWNNLRIKTLIGYSFTSNGNTGVYTVNGCGAGDTSCMVSFTGSSYTNNRRTVLVVDYVKQNGTRYKTKVNLYEKEPTMKARAYPGLMGFCDFDSKWQHTSWSSSSGKIYTFYEAVANGAKLPDCSESAQNGKLFDFKGWSKGYEAGDTLTTTSTCQDLVPVGTTAVTGETYAPCYELVPHVRLTTNGGVVKQDSTWSFNPDDMTYLSVGTSLTDTVVLPSVTYSGYHSSSTLSYWRNDSTGEIKNAGESVKLDGSVWSAVADNVTTRVDLYKVVSLNSTEVFTVDGMTSCSLTTGSSSYLGVSYSNGDCQVTGLKATDFEQFVDVLVELSDGSTRIYKFTVEDRTGVDQNGNGIFIVDTDDNIIIGENDETITNSVYTDQCNTFKVSSDNYSKSKIGFARSAKKTSQTIYSGAYYVTDKCDTDNNTYVAFCLDPGRKGPGEMSGHAAEYVKASDVNIKTDFGKLIAYIVKTMKIDEFNSYISDTSGTIDEVDIQRVASHVALRISAIKNGLSTAVDSADLVYSSHYYPYAAVAEKLAELDEDGDISPEDAEDALKHITSSGNGFSWTGSGYDYSSFYNLIASILSSYDGSDGTADNAGFERTIDKTDVTAIGTKGYSVSYEGTITVPSGTSTATLKACNATKAAETGISCEVNKFTFSEKYAEGSRKIYDYKVTIKADDASKVKVPTGSTQEKDLAFIFEYDGAALVQSAFIANPSDGSDSLQRMLILTTSTPDIYIYFSIVPRDCDLPFLNKDNCKDEESCKANNFNSDLFVAAGCCRYVLDGNKYNYILNKFCEPKCTKSTLSSTCAYTTSGKGKADLYTIREGEQLVSGSNWMPNVGSCVANVSNYYINDSAKSVENITNSNKFIYKDDANNLMNVEAYKNNRYCQVTCKEDWQIAMDSFGNFIGENAVAAGTYFQIVSNDIFISGTRTCYTSFINYDRFMANIVDLSAELVNKYNGYSEWSHVWTDINDQKTVGDSTIKYETVNPVCVEYHKTCPDGYFWHDGIKDCKQVPNYTSGESGANSSACDDPNNNTNNKGWAHANGTLYYNNGGANNKDTKCRFNRYYCGGHSLSGIQSASIKWDTNSSTNYTCTYKLRRRRDTGTRITSYTSPTDYNSDECTAAGGSYTYLRCEYPKCAKGYTNYNNNCYAACNSGETAGTESDTPYCYREVTKDANKKTNLTVDVIYNDGELKCKVYGKGYNYTLSTKNTTTKNNKDGYDVYYGTSQGTPNSMVNVESASNKSDTYTTISTTQSGTGAVKGNYSKTYTHSCTITAAEYSPGAQGSSECKQTNFQGTYTKKNEMFCKDGKYAKLTGTDLDKAFCKADDEDYDHNENTAADDSDYANKATAFTYMRTNMLEQAKNEASGFRSSMMSYHSSIYAHAYDIFDCQHFQLHNNTDDMDSSRVNNAIANDKIMGSTRSYVKILTEFDPTASYTYDEKEFMTILGKDNILEQFTEKNDGVYGGDKKYAQTTNAAKEIVLNLGNGSTYRTSLYRNYIQNYYYSANSGPWGVDTNAYKNYDDGHAIRDIDNVSESSKKIVMCTVYDEVIGEGKTEGKDGAVVAFAITGGDPEWHGGRCYAVEVDYKNVHYVKSSISNSSYYKNKGKWYVSGSDIKEHGDTFADALNNANNRPGSNTNYNVDEEKGRWSKLGDFNVFPVSMATPRNLYQYTYTFGQIGSYSDGKLGRIMGTTKSIIKDNTRSCFYEVFEEVCLCCGYTLKPGDVVFDYIESNGSKETATGIATGFDYNISDLDKIKDNSGGSLSFYTNSVSLGNLELGRTDSAANWSEDQIFMYNGISSLTTDKGAQLKALIEQKGETIYANKPEYAYYLTPDALKEIRYYNDAVGYELNYNNLILYGANTIACTSDSCNDSIYDSKGDPKVLFQHYGSKFLAGKVTHGIKINNFSYGLIDVAKPPSSSQICFVTSDNVDQVTQMMENKGCRWIDYVDTGNDYTDPATGEELDKFRLAFK